MRDLCHIPFSNENYINFFLGCLVNLKLAWIYVIFFFLMNIVLNFIFVNSVRIIINTSLKNDSFHMNCEFIFSRLPNDQRNRMTSWKNKKREYNDVGQGRRGWCGVRGRGEERRGKGGGRCRSCCCSRYREDGSQAMLRCISDGGEMILRRFTSDAQTHSRPMADGV